MPEKKITTKGAFEITGSIAFTPQYPVPSIGLKISREWEGGQQKEEVSNKPFPEANGRFVFLRHRIGKWVDSGYGYDWRLVTIWLSSFEKKYLDKIGKVIYYLPKSFANSVRKKINTEEKFYTSTAAYGDFNISAEVFIKNNKRPIIINRLINVNTSMGETKKPLE